MKKMSVGELNTELFYAITPTLFLYLFCYPYISILFVLAPKCRDTMQCWMRRYIRGTWYVRTYVRTSLFVLHLRKCSNLLVDPQKVIMGFAWLLMNPFTKTAVYQNQDNEYSLIYNEYSLIPTQCAALSHPKCYTHSALS